MPEWPWFLVLWCRRYDDPVNEEGHSNRRSYSVLHSRDSAGHRLHPPAWLHSQRHQTRQPVAGLQGESTVTTVSIMISLALKLVFLNYCIKSTWPMTPTLHGKSAQSLFFQLWYTRPVGSWLPVLGHLFVVCPEQLALFNLFGQLSMFGQWGSTIKHS